MNQVLTSEDKIAMYVLFPDSSLPHSLIFKEQDVAYKSP